MQNRLKSWALWVALAALIGFVVKQVTGVDFGATINGLLNVLLPMVVGLGIINNPTSSDSL